MRDEQRPEGSWQVATRSARERTGVGEAGAAHRGKHEVSRGASLKSSRSRRWHSRETHVMVEDLHRLQRAVWWPNRNFQRDGPGHLRICDVERGG